MIIKTQSNYSSNDSKQKGGRDQSYDLLKKKIAGSSDREKRCFECPFPVSALAFGCRSSDKNWHSTHVSYNHTKFTAGKILLAAGLTNGDIIIWDTDSSRIVLVLRDHKLAITDLCFSLDGCIILSSASKDCTVKLWDLQNDGNMFKTLEGHTKIVSGLSWSPNNGQLATVGVGRSVMIWNVRTQQLERKLEGHQNDVTACEFSPDGALLYTASCDSTVICWDALTGVQKAVFHHMFPKPRPIFAGGLNGHEVRDISVAKDGRHIATSCHDGYLRIWDIYNPNSPIQIVHVPDQRAMKFSSDGFVVGLCCRSGLIQFFSTPMSISTIQQACRLVIRRQIGETLPAEVQLPRKLTAFLSYAEVA